MWGYQKPTWEISMELKILGSFKNEAKLSTLSAYHSILQVDFPDCMHIYDKLTI